MQTGRAPMARLLAAHVDPADDSCLPVVDEQLRQGPLGVEGGMLLIDRLKSGDSLQRFS